MTPTADGDGAAMNQVSESLSRQLLIVLWLAAFGGMVISERNTFAHQLCFALAFLVAAAFWLRVIMGLRQ